MEKNEFRRYAGIMIYLTSCALDGRKPSLKRLENIDMNKLFEVCQKHILTACAAYALESAGINDKEFTQAKNKAIRKNILHDAQRSLILMYMENQGIWYMPLKGAVLKSWYPRIGMRQMSDNDILFDKSRIEDVDRIMTDLHYKGKKNKLGVDIPYYKEPVLNFEMHFQLFSDAYERNSKLCSYYENVRERLVQDSDSKFGYHFTDEDLYIYMIAHEYKHYVDGGTGVRSLVDTYVFLSKAGDRLDWDYIKGELDKLGIREYERMNRELAMDLFGKHKLTDNDKRQLDYYVLSGTYGTIENSITNDLAQHNDRKKIAYVYRRLFPTYKRLCIVAPWLKGRRYLLPAAWLWRIVRGLVVNRKRITGEIICLMK